MYNKTKKIIILLIVLLLIISVILIIALNILKKKNNMDDFISSVNEVGSSIIDEYGETINNSISREAYFDINTCMTIYLDTINNNNSNYYVLNEKGDYVKVEEEVINNSIYNLLSKNYIDRNNITEKNVQNYVKMIDEKCVFVPLEASVLQDKNIDSFLVHGLVESIRDYKVVDDLFFVINIDATYNTFSIEQIYGEYKSIKEISINSFEESIEKNTDNAFKRQSVSYETVIKDYINKYKRLALGAPETLYNILDEEYRQKRFGNLYIFKKYISENRENIIGIRVEEYLVNDESEYKEYVAKDQYGNLYIFNEIATLNYNMMLDTYTLEQPKFNTEYAKASDQKKVMMNIDKFFQMINAKDYKAAYNCLSESFKNNNFKTEQSFETYAKSYFYNYNDVSYNAFKTTSSGVYGYELTLKDKQNTSNSKIFNIVMKLNSGTDFEMSFEV